MNFGIPSLLIQKQSAQDKSFRFFKTKVQYKIAKFQQYEGNEKISGEIEIPQIGAKCLLEITGFGEYEETSISITVSGLCEEFQTTGKYKISIQALVGDDIILPGRDMSITSNNVTVQNVDHEEVIEKLDSSGTLVLDIEISFFIYEAFDLPIHVRNWNIDCKKLVGDLGRMLKTSEFSDFKFIVKGKEFKVHRNILAAASPVFSTMFKAGMEETKSNECVIKDIEPEIFEHLLQFIYERQLPENLAEVAMNLYEAAHYYDIQELKEICFQEIPRQLNTENAVKIFNWGCVYNEDFKNKAWKIIKRDIFKFYLPSSKEPPSTPEALQKMILKKKEIEMLSEDLAKLF